MNSKHWLAAALLAACLSPTGAQTPPPRCAGPAYHAFDFWVGDWSVHGADGTLLGHNTVTAFAGGCGLLEHWRGARGGEGMSVNAYDAANDRWTQRWVGAGGVLWLTGGPVDGAMVMADDANRITWTPQADGSVRQLWEATQDGGATWQVVFDGCYRKRDGGGA